ncbi:MAG: hypothetical protein RL397_1533 [Pseudomonadota bacterium]
MTMPQPLDLLRFPLSGSRLIEASAGTGKTYTIAFLYLRLVLGHGTAGVAPPGMGLTPEQILVVTFTEAATEELRSRVRKMLVEAAILFSDRPSGLGPAGQDAALLQLRAAYLPADWPLCAQRLDRAAESMDSSAILTIHSWCYRMLQEHAFESRTLFQQVLTTDLTAQRRDAVRDYWRRFYDPLSQQDMSRVSAFWADPEALDRRLAPLLSYADWAQSEGTPERLLHAHDAAVQERLAPLKQQWAVWVPELRALFAQAREARAFDLQRLAERWYVHWFDTIAAWAADSTATELSIGKGWERLTPQGLAEAWCDGSPPPHPALEQTPLLRAAIEAASFSPTPLLAHALAWVSDAVRQGRRLRSELHFDDMLRHLAEALAGDGSAYLAASIRRKFPVALIDEFQDTDPTQYAIFDRVYGVAHNRQDTALVLIGDPKQAIYSFRQADIYTYLRARADVDDRIQTLGTNYRATEAMVSAVNGLFAQAEARTGSAGAFLFRRDNDNPVPFSAVSARGRDQAFELVSGSVCPMQWVVYGNGTPPSKDSYLTAMAAQCAQAIAFWLSEAEAMRAGFRHRETQQWQALQPADIAVLVDNGIQASLVRRALAQQGLRSVYLSDKETVYATPQAREVYRWLVACAHPERERLVRAALATDLVGLRYDQVYALTEDEWSWETTLERFKAYREIWWQRGVLPMLRRFLVDYGVTQRLLRLPIDAQGQTGERILTDLLHLAELLQQASTRLDGPDALIRFFAEQCDSPEQADEGRRRRLESDEQLIRVVTIHKSKGLEYPLVFLPFASAARPVKPNDCPLKWHDEKGRLEVSFGSVGPEVLRAADRDRLSEDMRKLYVALTRAQYAAWVGVAPIEQPGPAAVDVLLGLGDAVAAPNTYAQRLREALADPECHSVVTASATETAVYRSGRAMASDPDRLQGAALPGHPRRVQRQGFDGWSITSYSAMRTRGSVASDLIQDADSALAENLQEMEELPSVRDEGSLNPAGPLHRFPRGSEPGSFLHGLLEWAARQGFSAVVNHPQSFSAQVAQQCLARGWSHWAEPLAQWMLRTMTHALPVDVGVLRLEQADLARPEVEFWFAASDVALAGIDAVVTEGLLPGRARRPLESSRLTGMLKGFIDLVVTHNGRYFVLDYKSNWLGPTDADYSAEALNQAVVEHRYELQYALYLLALHRLLRSRIPDYDYDRHVGGAVYLFLRGLDGPAAGVHYQRPERQTIEALDRLFVGSAEQVRAA